MAKAPTQNQPEAQKPANAVPSNPGAASVGVRKPQATNLSNGTKRIDY